MKICYKDKSPKTQALRDVAVGNAFYYGGRVCMRVCDVLANTRGRFVDLETGEVTSMNLDTHVLPLKDIHVVVAD